MKGLRIKKGVFVALLCTLMVFLALCASAASTTFNWKEDENANGNYPCDHKHIYGDWIIKEEDKPTCMKTGKRYRECIFSYEGKDCPHIYVEDLPKDPTYHVDITEIVEKEATCDLIGISKSVCKCGKTDIVYTDTVEHTFDNDWEVVNYVHEETRSVDGSRSNTCSVCGTHVTEEIPVVHTFDGEVSVERDPTCTKKGLQYEYCTVCKAYKIVETDPIPENHVFTSNPLPVGTVDCQNGGEGIVICEDCGEFVYVDISPDKAHDYLDWTYKAPDGTCADNALGYIFKECEEHNKSYNYKGWIGHVLDEDAKTYASTCSNYGYKKGTCTICGEKNVEVVINVDPEAHSWIEEVLIEPTCSEEGYAFRICKYDSRHIEYGSVPVLGHKFSREWKIVKPATCATLGIKTNICDVCGETVEEDIEFDLENHNIPESAWSVETKPDCRTVGTEKAYCPYCDAAYGQKFVVREVPKHSRKYVDTLVEFSRTEPTCCLAGKIVYKCKGCGDDVEEIIPVDPDAHRISTGYHVVKPATCSEKDEDGDGLIDGLGILAKICEYCRIPFVEFEYSEEHPDGYKTFERAGHVVGPWEVTRPTCTEDGYKTRECTKCGHTEQQTLSKTHSYEEWVVDDTYPIKATCTERGRRMRGCYNCDMEPQIEYYYGEHDTGKWEFITGNCEVGGTLRKKCKNCESYVSQKTVEAGEHVDLIAGEVKYAVSESVCSQITYTCSLCNETLKETLSHQFTSYNKVQPYADLHELCVDKTCEKEHKTINKKNYHIICTDKDCKEYHEPSQSTCELNGWTDKKYCMVCKYFVDQKYVPATGHDFEYDDEGTKFCLNCKLYYTADGKTCNHFCHNNGTVAKVMTKIFTLFWKIFGLNEICKCGAAHY